MNCHIMNSPNQKELLSYILYIFLGFLLLRKVKQTKNMSKTALITGATSGIGKATAQILAKNNYKIIL